MRLRTLFSFFIVAVIAAGCEHESFVVVGGKGGNATIVVYPQHHLVTTGLDSMMVYVKYNTLDAPANGVYDDSAACTNLNGLPFCSFTSLKNGNYYFYATGYDYNISGRVKGGTPYSVTAQAQQNLALPVSEENH